MMKTPEMLDNEAKAILASMPETLSAKDRPLSRPRDACSAATSHAWKDAR